MAKDKKNGPITQEEKEFIRANMNNLSAKQIAEELGRNPNTILSFINSIDGVGNDLSNILSLKKREDWSVIKGQFSDEEILIFEYHWNEIVKQFREDLRHSESIQILNAIKHEILGNRALTDQRKLTKQILETESKLEIEYERDPPDSIRIDQLEKLMMTLSTALEVNNKEYRECNGQLSKALKDLKATREMRLSKIDDSRKSFSVWMNRLMEEPQMQRDFGRYGAKMRLAIEGEAHRLGSVMKYADKTYDRPLLNVDTLNIETDIEELEKEENNEN
jgi:hypothetical protein